MRFLNLLSISLISLAIFASDGPTYTSDELNTINIFKNSVSSVVYVSTIQKGRNPWFYGASEIPAGTGSGFVWDDAGHIVTNYHVIKDGNKFKINFHNNKEEYEARLVGVEPNKDIAILKVINPPSNIKAIKVGTSKNLLVGQRAIAIGNPFGLDHTMTVGIISALDRKIDGVGGVKIHGMIQTDASINPGNSGGPLLNSQGELIGMNTLIFSSSGSSAGIGFAVPVDSISRVVPQIITHGKVIRPGLGIGPFPDHAKQRFGITKGVIIGYVDENGPAAKAGLEGLGQDNWGRIYLGDIILKIDDLEVNTLDDIYHALDKYKSNDVVTVQYLREGKIKQVKVTLKTL